MSKMTPLNTSEDVAWAIEVHAGEGANAVPAKCSECRFAILYGNEDAPTKIEFWFAENPHYQAKPDFSWTPDEV